MFAWGIGSTVVNFGAFILGCSYLSCEWPGWLAAVGQGRNRKHSGRCRHGAGQALLQAWRQGGVFEAATWSDVLCIPSCPAAYCAALKSTKTVAEEVVIERNLSKGQGLEKLQQLVSSGG